MRPIVYYGNLLNQPGTIAWEAEDKLGFDVNPHWEAVDNSLNVALSGYAVSAPFFTIFQIGAITLALDEPDFCNALVMPSGSITSGSQVIMDSENRDGSDDVEVLNQTFPDGATSFIMLISGGVDPLPRVRWTTGMVNVNNIIPLQYVNELMLAKRLVLPRTPEVGVTRDRVRQFKRIDVPNGQAFVKKLGPMLRRTSYSFVAVSGAERDAVNAFVDAVDGGQPFYFTDDLGDTYWAEIPEPVVTTSDEAGIDNMQITFQEIKQAIS